MIKNINYNFQNGPDKELIAKINAVAPFESRKVHDLGRLLLLEGLNSLIARHGISQETIRSAMAD